MVAEIFHSLTKPIALNLVTRLLFHCLLVCGLATFFYGCTKGPGEGGTSTIAGKIYVKNYNGSGILVSEFYAPEERVYLLFGDATFYGADTRTSFDGSYEFPYLKKGDYTIFAYSDCDTCASKVIAVQKQVTITSNHSRITVDDIVLRK